MVRCALILLAVVLFASTQNANGLKCYVCSDCENVEGKTTEECSSKTTTESTTSAVTTASSSSAVTTASSSSAVTTESSSSAPTTKSTTQAESSSESTSESTSESSSVTPSLILTPEPNVPSVKLFARYKRDVLYDNRAEEYGGCFKYTSDDKINRGCVKTNDVTSYCNSKTDCTVCTDGDGCNSSVSVMASAILAVIGVTILRILQ